MARHRALAIAQVKALVEGAAPKSEKKRRFDHSSELGGLEAEVEDLVGSICDSESKAALTRTLALTLSLSLSLSLNLSLTLALTLSRSIALRHAHLHFASVPCAS